MLMRILEMMMVIVRPHHAAFTVKLSLTKSLLLYQEMAAAASNAKDEILLTIVHSSPILNIILILSQQ